MIIVSKKNYNFFISYMYIQKVYTSFFTRILLLIHFSYSLSR